MVVHNAYGAMAGGGRGHVGGVERQTSMTARWLAAQGYAVSILTWDEGQPDREVIDGVQVVKMCREDEGLPILRFFHPRASSLFAAMDRADADVYYHNCAEHYTGLVAWWCRKNRRKFVYSVAHDYGCSPRNPMLSRPHERFLYRYGLKAADRIIVQTESQRKMMREGFGLDSVVLPMPCRGPEGHEGEHGVLRNAEPVIWVGRAAPIKRMEWLFRIAELCPQTRFQVAAGNANTSYSTTLCEATKAFPNVEWLGSVPRDRMAGLYQRASALCCTSVNEGFPNTFLEAWSWGCPVVTSFDPDGIVARDGLGITCHSVEDFAAAIRGLRQEPEKWAAMSRAGEKYFRKNHALNVAMDRFEREFVSVCRRTVLSSELVSIR